MNNLVINSKGKKSVRFKEDDNLVATLFINSDADSDNDSSDFSVSMSEPAIFKPEEENEDFETLFKSSSGRHLERRALKIANIEIENSDDLLFIPKITDPSIDLHKDQINDVNNNLSMSRSHSSSNEGKTTIKEVESPTKKKRKSKKLRNGSPSKTMSSKNKNSYYKTFFAKKQKIANLRNPTKFEMNFAKVDDSPLSFDLSRGAVGTFLTPKRRFRSLTSFTSLPKHSSDPRTMNDYFVELKRQKIAKSKLFGGKIVVQYVDYTDKNLEILYKMFKRIQKMSAWPSVEGINKRIASLETSFKAVGFEAPDGFDPHEYRHWQLLRSSITDEEYLPDKHLKVPVVDLTPVPLSSMPFNGLVIPGSCLGQWTTYGLTLDSFNCDCETKKCEERIAFEREDESEDFILEPSSHLKTKVGNAYRFPKLLFPNHKPHPLTVRLRNKIAKVTFKSPYIFLSKTPPMTPSMPPPQKPQTTVTTLFEKPIIYCRPHSSQPLSPTEQYFQPILDKPQLLMLTKTRAEINFHASRKKEIVTQPCSKAHIVRYKPEPWDYSTIHKTTHCFPSGQQSTQQTSQSLFKQILRHDEICGNPKCKHCRSPKNLYQDLMDDDTMISLHREEVFDLIDTLPDVPLYIPVPGQPGHYSPCAPPSEDHICHHPPGFNHHVTNCFRHKKRRPNFCCQSSPEDSESEIWN